MSSIYCAEHDWQIIVNPNAGGGLREGRWANIEQQLAPLLPRRRVVFTTYRGQARELAAAAVASGCRHILAVGGDGTHHEVVNGILEAAGERSAEVVYALLPVGTGNDWIRTHGIPKNLPAWLELFRRGRLCRQNAGRLRYVSEGLTVEHYFANVAGLAYDGFVVEVAHRQPPRRGGRWFYLYLTLRCLFRYRPQRARLYFDGQVEEDAFYTINAGICRYSGGGMQLTPQAHPDGDQLALTYARAVSRLGVLINTYRFYNGTIGRHPRITTTYARHIRIEAGGDGPVLLEADGEFLGETPVEISLLPAALTFVG